MTKAKKKIVEPVINIFDKSEIEKWCSEFNCTREVLIDAILTAGKSVKEVKAFLKARNKKRK
ncbi:MAG TPA: DUF3606 domain-containing protein [Bacteroidia bacterium]|jgi:hypothetical protein|nr:DUF3606 domain-containing protein [Bacteroidia bacterium]